MNRSRGSTVKVIGMIPVYNESDVIASVIEHLLSQGVELVILDNSSTDGSQEIESRYFGKDCLRLKRSRLEDLSGE